MPTQLSKTVMDFGSSSGGKLVVLMRLPTSDALRSNSALAAALEKPGEALVGKSTLNRAEHAGKTSTATTSSPAIERLSSTSSWSYIEIRRSASRLIIQSSAKEDSDSE